MFPWKNLKLYLLLPVTSSFMTELDIDLKIAQVEVTAVEKELKAAENLVKAAQDLAVEKVQAA